MLAEGLFKNLIKACPLYSREGKITLHKLN